MYIVKISNDPPEYLVKSSKSAFHYDFIIEYEPVDIEHFHEFGRFLIRVYNEFRAQIPSGLAFEKIGFPFDQIRILQIGFHVAGFKVSEVKHAPDSEFFNAVWNGFEKEEKRILQNRKKIFSEGRRNPPFGERAPGRNEVHPGDPVGN